MPRASNAVTTNNFARLLLIGDGKIGKTYYAGLPAESGFNVLYLNGDVANETIQQLPDKAKQNLLVMNVGDRLQDGGAIGTQFVQFMMEFFGKIKVLWNDTDSKILTNKDLVGEGIVGKDVWEIFPSKLNYNWVLVIDSWTSLVQSAMMMVARAEGVDISAASSAQMRAVYAGAGQKLTQFLVIIQRIQCHVIVIAHPDEFVKQERPEGVRVKDIKETDMRVLWTKMIPKSCSKPHALTMAKFFTDVAWMETNPAGTERRLNFKLSPERISGGHWTDVKKMEEYSFAKLIALVGGFIPTENAPLEPALVIHENGSFAPAEAKVLQNSDSTTDSPVAAGNTTSAIQAPKGFAALMAKKAS